MNSKELNIEIKRLKLEQTTLFKEIQENEKLARVLSEKNRVGNRKLGDIRARLGLLEYNQKNFVFFKKNEVRQNHILIRECSKYICYLLTHKVGNVVYNIHYSYSKTNKKVEVQITNIKICEYFKYLPIPMFKSARHTKEFFNMFIGDNEDVNSELFKKYSKLLIDDIIKRYES